MPPAATGYEEHTSAIFTEQYADYLHLGIEEWRKSYAEHKALGKKAVLFVMVDDTRNCDEVGAWLEKTCPDLQGAVLVIHTKNNGEISESASGKNKEELELLRKQANEIDSWASPYKAIVSVLMLKEGLGRSQRHHHRRAARVRRAKQHPPGADPRSRVAPHVFRHGYSGNRLGHGHARLHGIRRIHPERGRQLRIPCRWAAARRARTRSSSRWTPQNTEKNLDALDIALPRLTRRFNREFKDLDALDPASFGNPKLPLKPFTPEETREIVFKTMLDAEIHHTIQLDGAGPADYRSVVGFFARQLLKDLRLVGGYDVLYPKVKAFMAGHLFAGSPVDLEDPVVLRNLSEPEAGKILFDAFKTAINALTVQDTGSTRIEDRIRLRDTRPFRTENRPYLAPKKSLFNKIVGEPHAGGFELAFAGFLDAAPDVAAFAKNYLAVGFKLDYVKADGDLSNYIPDFIVRTTDGTVWIVETKGRAELDLPQKMARLRQWCADATSASRAEGGPAYRFVYVDEQGYDRNPPKNFAGLVQMFLDYQS